MKEIREKNPKDIVAFVIPKGLICEHRFLIYLDKHMSVRCFAPVDELYNLGNTEKYKLDPIVVWSGEFN
jgi:hypothetical protein